VSQRPFKQNQPAGLCSAWQVWPACGPAADAQGRMVSIEQRMATIEGVDVTETILEALVQRAACTAPLTFNGELVIVKFPGVGGNASFQHQAPQVAKVEMLLKPWSWTPVWVRWLGHVGTTSAWPA